MNQHVIETIKPNPNVLIYGSGLSGLSTALKLAYDDVRVDILSSPDDEVSLGYLHELLHDPALITRLREEAMNYDKITFLPDKDVRQILTTETGFSLTANNGNSLNWEYGTIIFAPERVEQPNNEGTLNLTQLYAKLFAKDNIQGAIVCLLDHQDEIQSEVFRDLLYAALQLQKRANTEVWVLAKHVQVALQKQEELYDQCREAGVIFIKYRDEIEIHKNNDGVGLTGFDTQVGSVFTIPKTDMLIVPQKTGLSAPALAFAQSLNIRILNEQYTQPDSLWRLPNETNRPGIFAVGAARGNMDRQAILNDAVSVALSVRERLKPGGIVVEEHIPVVDQGKCVFCLTCVRTCPFGAMEKGTGRAANVNLLACQACGTCVAECPAGALQMRNLEDSTIYAGIRHA